MKRVDGPIADRLRARSSIDAVSGCWIADLARDKDGYCNFTANGRTRKAHRVSYETFVGPIPDGLTLDHVEARGCTSRACINPAHLEPVPLLVNQARSSNGNLGKTRCKRGHPFDKTNTAIRSGTNGVPKRSCRLCESIRWAAQWERRKRAAQTAGVAP